MDSFDESSRLENRLMQEIQSVDQQLRTLQDQRRVLETLLLKVRREGLASRTVTRRNSVNRILIETTILETLRASNRPTSSGDLYRAVLLRDSTVKDNTFRSYIHRLSQREDIKSVPGSRGKWILGSIKT